MKLTKAQLQALENISAWDVRYGRSFHKEAASKTVFAVRQNVLERLEKLGLIASQRPFAGSYHHVSLTDAGRDALASSKENGK